MTLPAVPPISWNEICAEFGLNPATAVWPNDFYGKGGAPSSGILGFQDFLGRTAVSFNPPAGTYADDAIGAVVFTITSNVPATWTWSRTGTGTGSITSGSVASSITFEVNAGAGPQQQGIFTVSATAQGVTANYTITLTADSSGGG
jgi:hypothetical protein